MSSSSCCFHWSLCGLLVSLYFIHSTSTKHVYIVYLGNSKDNDPVLATQSHFQLLSKLFSRYKVQVAYHAQYSTIIPAQSKLCLRNKQGPNDSAFHLTVQLLFFSYSEEEINEAMLYSYKHSFSGFSAMLNSTQAATLTNMEDVISVFRSNVLQLHTTRSWDFLGLTLEHNQVTPMQLVYGDDTVVGIFDTGIWPEASSFQESPEIGPIPSSWKGTCVKGEKFDPTTACNRKLIGARYYLKGLEQMFGPLNSSSGINEYRSSRDFLGHGTHTASTAIGSIVTNASFSGLAMGIARGGAPRSRLAVYKVCWSIQLDGRCTEADILAAFDDALHDGVNVISASFGGSIPLLPFFVSSSDIGSFHATQLGISVVFSGGNDGVEPGLVQNVAPWGICVAASSIDRIFPTQLIVDNNFTIMGGSFNVKKLKATLVYGSRYFNGGSCNIDNWNSKFATGKIILCFSTVGSVLASEASIAAFVANASALIFVDSMTKQISNVDIIPIIHITIDQGTRIMHYIAQSPKNPTVLMEPSRTMVAQSPAPAVAYFSSRGPSSLAPDILKPDITAPGINILAAWPLKSPPTLLPIDHRSVNWNFQSGTSMSCPHVSGVVALLKSAHPDWSPAAIKSAIMTTAETKDTSGDDILAGGSMKHTDPFDIGAGHINPVKALDPGLVYDMSMQDYVVFLCNIGYNEKQIKSIVVRQSPCIDTSCPKTKSSNAELNFPSITVTNLQHSMTIKRAVRNVGHKNDIYFVKIVKPHGVDVEIWPRMLIFSSHCREKSYYVSITPKKHSQGRFDFGEIVWSDGNHYVRIPLVVCVNNTASSVYVDDSSTHASI